MTSLLINNKIREISCALVFQMERNKIEAHPPPKWLGPKPQTKYISLTFNN